MPYIDIRTTKKVDDATRNKLQTEIANIMELIPGKNAGNTTISINDNYTMYREYKQIEAVFIDIRLYKESLFEDKSKFAEKLFSVIEDVLNTPPSLVQMNFMEQQCWASNGDLF